jgi:hypothetical protein
LLAQHPVLRAGNRSSGIPIGSSIATAISTKRNGSSTCGVVVHSLSRAWPWFRITANSSSSSFRSIRDACGWQISARQNRLYELLYELFCEAMRNGV